MNFYNIEQFRCTYCQGWFHPVSARPYLMDCQHSVCQKCIEGEKNRGKNSIFCHSHKSQQHFKHFASNQHIQDALLRIMKNVKQEDAARGQSHSSSLVQHLQFLIQEKYEDIHAFSELLERIYQNQINRILHLKSRVKDEVLGHFQAYQQWKSYKEGQKDKMQILEEGKALEKRIKEFNELNFEEMAGKVIDDPPRILKRNFSIYDLVQRQRKTFKSATKQRPEKYQNSSISSIPFKKDKQNDRYMNFLVNTVESPQPVSATQNDNPCKELSSFKLDSSPLKEVPENTMKNERYLLEHLRHSNSLLDEHFSNSQLTQRDNEHSKGTVKTKPNQRLYNHKPKRSHFSQLINSLKSESELAYSSEISSEEMLLSEAKPEINFLQECPLERNDKKSDIQIKQRKIINYDRQNNKYIKKMEEVRSDEAASKTILSNSTLQLFNYDLKEVDLKLFFDRFDWRQLQVVKLVGTGLQDSQFNQLLNYMIRTKVHSVLLPNNDLQEISLDALLNFSKMNSNLRTVSLQRNNINKLNSVVRSKINLIGRKGITLYI